MVRSFVCKLKLLIRFNRKVNMEFGIVIVFCIANSCITNVYAKYSSARDAGATWWRHQMETFSALLVLCAGNSPVPENSPHKGQWRGALMFSLICTWINDWVNNREAGDLRRHRGHYDVNVMETKPFPVQANVKYAIDGLVQVCSISIVNALEILHFCANPSIYLLCFVFK